MWWWVVAAIAVVVMVATKEAAARVEAEMVTALAVAEINRLRNAAPINETPNGVPIAKITWTSEWQIHNTVEQMERKASNLYNSLDLGDSTQQYNHELVVIGKLLRVDA